MDIINPVQGLGHQATDKIDDTTAIAYFDSIREHFPDGFEEQLWNGGVSQIVNSYIGVCFMTDVDPKSCAEIILLKVGANDA